MIVKSSEQLKELGKEIFTALGASRDRASFIADTLVESSLTGHDSHGVIYFVRYSDRIRKGFIDVNADPVKVKETETSALIDGRWGFGQITAMRSVELAVEKARRNVVGAVGAFRCNHIGRLGYYTSWIAKQGFIGMMFANVGHPAVSVYHGLGRVFGTNPFSASVPVKGSDPFLLDYATSVVAEGKVSVARAKHEKIPENWIRDKSGNKTDDPNAMLEGGWLLPFGEHKGYCLQLLVELLGGILTGSRSGLDSENEPPSPNGVFSIAIDPGGFRDRDEFASKTETMLKKVRLTPNESGARILVPGDPEWETRRERLRCGIPIPEDSWQQIVQLSRELGIDPKYYS